MGGRLGFVNTIGDGVISATGLKQVAFGELVYFPFVDIKGFACGLNKNSVDILVFGNPSLIRSGSIIIGTGSTLRVPISKKMLGRVINPLGESIDGGESLSLISHSAKINSKAPGIIYRQGIVDPIFTGIKIIDILVPIGRGQKELIIGDKGTGKSSVTFDSILNQKKENYFNSSNPVFCIYVSIGQKLSSVRTLLEKFKKLNANNHVIYISASSSESAAFQYLAPYSGFTLGEYFMSFAHSLVILDDLTQHAMAYRQVSLLLRRSPGREAYPGDVFYLHSRLLERAANLSEKYGSGSLTALPIIETMFGDVSTYIPTNVISITDGQIFLDRLLFREGIIPAVNIGLSVSRVGSSAQMPIMKKIIGSLKLILSQYREVKDFEKFGSNLDEATLKLIRRGELLTFLLKQNRFNPVTLEDQLITFYSGLNGYLDKKIFKKVVIIKNKILNYLSKSTIFTPHFKSLRHRSYNYFFSLEGLKVSFKYFEFLKFKKEIETWKTQILFSNTSRPFTERSFTERKNFLI